MRRCAETAWVTYVWTLLAGLPCEALPRLALAAVAAPATLLVLRQLVKRSPRKNLSVTRAQRSPQAPLLATSLEDPLPRHMRRHNTIYPQIWRGCSCLSSVAVAG